MLVRFSKWLVVLALCLSIGAHWAILQTVAWCGMAVSYSQSSTLQAGLAKTFDGKHPCKLCRLVAEGKKSERKQEVQLKLVKTELCPIWEINPLFVPPLARGFFPADFSPVLRNEAPLTQPPRLA